ncbi:hypothetical protein BCV69DRAFT_245491 [Microstroma glucosiphilum]|uniref:Allergen n=1 Tax=Pseudomicrostroma glucosiphilum TaxID=1684307 RepID=A0A316UHE2_9BASI|nr:hypothetical protein BCV69DRAFT_245491 [Pseudomicrostroma glucosiphilum]PWN23353.1 hypothetical protein BCV69DRAFT_245491 [Pseudomicrostroma glucosiphilum]
MNKLKEAFGSGRHSTDADSNTSNYTRDTSNTTPEMSPRGNRTSATGPSATDKASDARGDDSHAGRSTSVAQSDGLAGHTRGHNDKASPTDLNGEVHQDVQHLAHVTEETRQQHHVDEVTREKDLQSHHHHVQHHVQRVRDSEHAAEQHHNRVIPRTHIDEKHASTAKDAELLNTVANAHGHRDRVEQAPETRQVIDKGETINETVHHHVHNVIQPVIIKDSHEYHRHHTTIPTTHVAHHAPIIHESITHDTISKDDFIKSGGILGAKLTGVHQTGLLNDGKCDRTVDGVAENMERDLHLSPGQPQ